MASKEKLFGWGRYATVDCVVVAPRNLDELRELFKTCSANGISITPKGSGCSFGDIITNRQGVVLDTSLWNDIIHFDSGTGIITAQCGASAARVLNLTLPHHWIPRGLPGTSFGTMAGFIANNVHGKDSFKNGNFGTGVISIKMMLANGELITLSREEHPDIFQATIGGMGLLGVIIEVTLQLIKIPGSMVEIHRKYFHSVPELFDLFNGVNHAVDMDMAWFDGFHRRNRGIFQTANFLDQDPDPMPASMEHIEKKFMGKIPIGLVYPVVRPFACRATMSFMNKMAYWGSMTGKDSKALHLYNYYYPHMMSIPDSPIAIKGGLVGFQIIVLDQLSCEFIQKLLNLCHQHKLESWFGGIKRLKSDPFMISFAEDGYAITIEIPGRFTRLKKFPSFLDQMVSLTIDNKGKIFLGKDALLKPHHVRAMYPRLTEFLAIKNRCNPNALFESDLSKRLELS